MLPFNLSSEIASFASAGGKRQDLTLTFMNSADSAVMESVFFLDANRSLIRPKANVLTPDGINRWNVINIPQ